MTHFALPHVAYCHIGIIHLVLTGMQACVCMLPAPRLPWTGSSTARPRRTKRGSSSRTAPRQHCSLERGFGEPYLVASDGLYSKTRAGAKGFIDGVGGMHGAGQCYPSILCDVGERQLLQYPITSWAMTRGQSLLLQPTHGAFGPRRKPTPASPSSIRKSLGSTQDLGPSLTHARSVFLHAHHTLYSEFSPCATRLCERFIARPCDAPSGKKPACSVCAPRSFP